MSVCARCELLVVDRNPAEELKAACSVAVIYRGDYGDLNVIIKMHYRLRCEVRWSLRIGDFLVNTGHFT